MASRTSGRAAVFSSSVPVIQRDRTRALFRMRTGLTGRSRSASSFGRNASGSQPSFSFTLTRVTNFDRVAGWALKLNGRDYSGRSVSVDGSTIRLLQPKGSVIVVR